MAYVKCNQGHLYNTEQNESCPYCQNGGVVFKSLTQLTQPEAQASGSGGMLQPGQPINGMQPMPQPVMPQVPQMQPIPQPQMVPPMQSMPQPQMAPPMQPMPQPQMAPPMQPMLQPVMEQPKEKKKNIFQKLGDKLKTPDAPVPQAFPSNPVPVQAMPAKPQATQPQLIPSAPIPQPVPIQQPVMPMPQPVAVQRQDVLQPQPIPVEKQVTPQLIPVQKQDTPQVVPVIVEGKKVTPQPIPVVDEKQNISQPIPVTEEKKEVSPSTPIPVQKQEAVMPGAPIVQALQGQTTVTPMPQPVPVTSMPQQEQVQKTTQPQMAPMPQMQPMPQPQMAPMPQMQPMPQPQMAPMPQMQPMSQPQMAPMPQMQPMPQPQVAPMPQVMSSPIVMPSEEKIEETEDAPIIGWLVCLQGAEKGRDYRILGKNNSVGRGGHMDISIQGDTSIPRENYARITYDKKHKACHLVPGENITSISVNGNNITEPTKLSSFDQISFASVPMVYVQFVSDHFSWEV